MKVNGVDQVVLLSAVTTDISTGDGQNVERAISVSVSAVVDVTSTGSVVITVQGYNGAAWVTLGTPVTKSADYTGELYNSAFPAYTKIRAITSSTSGTVATTVTLSIKA